MALRSVTAEFGNDTLVVTLTTEKRSDGELASARLMVAVNSTVVETDLEDFATGQDLNALVDVLNAAVSSGMRIRTHR